MEKQKESVEVRGICAAIQSMAYPTFESLREILRRFGFDLVKISPEKKANP